MIRVFKTDMFRLFRSTAFYAFPLMLVVFFTVEMFFSAVVNEPETETETSGSAVNTETGTEDNASEGFSVSIGYTSSSTEDYDTPGTDVTADTDGISDDHGTGGTPYVPFGIGTLTGSLTDGLLMFFLGITVVIFATCETKNGFVKNAAGCVSDRGFMPLSKIAVGIVTIVIYTAEFAVIRFLFTALSALLRGRPLKYMPMPKDDAGRFFGYIMLCILAHIALTALLILLHELVHNRAAGLVAAFVISTGMLGELLNGMVHGIRLWTGLLKDFDINRYLLLSNMYGGYKGAGYHPSTMLLMCTVYIVAGTAGAVWVAKRKDIR